MCSRYNVIYNVLCNKSKYLILLKKLVAMSYGCKTEITNAWIIEDNRGELRLYPIIFIFSNRLIIKNVWSSKNLKITDFYNNDNFFLINEIIFSKKLKRTTRKILFNIMYKNVVTLLMWWGLRQIESFFGKPFLQITLRTYNTRCIFFSHSSHSRWILYYDRLLIAF